MVVAMDALALNLKTGCLSPVAGRKPRPTATWRLSAPIGGQSTEKSRKARSLSLTVVCASGKKKSNGPPFSENDEPLVPGGDGREESKTPHEKSEPFESKSYHVVSDWRDFRANLVAREKDILQKSEQRPESGTNPTGIPKGGKESPVWAHQTIPEVGCLLIATEEIDRDDNFQRSVVLLVSLGSRYPHEGHGPVGLILNRPLDRKVKDTETMHPGLASNFGNHQLHFGGPLQSSDVSMFLVKAGGGLIGIAHESGMQQVVSGVHFGGVKRIEEAAALVRGGVLEPSDFKFFAGYACWGYDQLMREIEMGYWVVAACSSNVIGCAITGTSDQMWQEVLQIMGGQYADLSKKANLDEPMQD